MEQAEYWHQQGLREFYQGHSQQALQMLEKAWQAAPQRLDFLNSLGIVRQSVGDLAGALHCFEILVQTQPEQADFQTNYAHLLLELGHGTEALARYRQVVRQLPQTGWCWLNLGKALYQLQCWTEAYESLWQAMRTGAGPEAAYWLGMLDFRRGLRQQAEVWLKQALQDGFLQAFNVLAEIYRQSRQWEKAEELFRRIRATGKTSPEILLCWSELLIEQARYTEAQRMLQELLQLRPEQPDVQVIQAWLWQKQGAIEQACQALHCLAARFPRSALVWLHLGNMYLEQGDHGAARQHFQQALICDPDYVRALVNLGLLALEENQPDLCLAFQQRALRLEPGNAWARLHQAHALFLSGRYPEAWDAYEARLDLLPGQLPLPVWQGEPLQGCHLLVLCEQGFGDSLQFIRFVPVLWHRYGKPRLTLCCQPPLLRLLALTLQGIAEVRSLDEKDHIPADRCISLLSLPRYLHIQPDQLYSETYLSFPPGELPPGLKSCLHSEKPRIGLVWSAVDGHDTQAKRSLSWAQLQPVIEYLPDCDFFALQLGSAHQQLKAVQSNLVVDVAPWLTDFAATACVLAHLDLLITVDTAAAHLAGGLGKPAWILLPWAADWRWGLVGERSPWYPSLRLFRQSQRGDWSGVLAALESALPQWLQTVSRTA